MSVRRSEFSRQEREMTFRNPLIPTQIDQGDLVDIIKNSRSVTLRGSDFADTNVGSTASFFYDSPGQGLKSTQQLNVDWSRFENHTFFNSAEVNTNVAFDKMINFFPFDGTRKEVENFFEKMTGFEKYVYDRFPKNNGFLFFSSSFIVVKDYAGGLFPEISKTKTGQSILAPAGSFTIEFQLYLPAITNDVQVVCQKIAGNDGITAFVTQSLSATSALVGMCITSGSAAATTSASFEKGRFHHVAFVYNKDDGANYLTLYKNGTPVATSTSNDIGRIAMDSAPLTIGSGSQFLVGPTQFVPQEILSGAMDEFRFFHSARTIEQLTQNAYKSIFPTEDLKLYYKFNEPTGSFGSSESDSINGIVLDSSGWSLHSFITNFSQVLRATGSISVPMTYEKLNLCPVLFPGHNDVVDLNVELLTSASKYDAINPNIITKLLPPHYIMQGREHEGLDSDTGPITDAYGGVSIPGKGKLGQTQLLLSMLYVWGKFFDEMKLYIDAFSKSEDVDYDSNKSAADHFLPLLFKKLGIKVPSFFVDSTIEQFIDAENLQPVISTDKNSLQYIQNQILRRVLVNLNEIVKSKGTQHSVRAFLRSMGFDPDNSFRIKEYGGPTRRNLSFSRESKNEIGKMLDFVSGGFAQTNGFFSSSKLEIGFPDSRVGGANHILKTLYTPHGISSDVNDGLWTSGSWTYEGLYRFPQGSPIPFTQSLVRMQITGSDPAANPGVIFNLLAISGSATSSPRIVLYGRPGYVTSTGTEDDLLTEALDILETEAGENLLIEDSSAGSSSPLLVMQLTGSNIFDGENWNISFGKSRNDEVRALTSSYYLRAAKHNVGQILAYATQTYFKEASSNDNPTLSALFFITSTLNASGSFLAIGSASLPLGGGYAFLHDSSDTFPSEIRSTLFTGQVAQMRFWSKSVSDVEWKEHIKNPKSFGVQDPASNFNFTSVPTGSFNRLRNDVSMDQQSRTTDAFGQLILTDYSQNKRPMIASGFPPNKQIFSPVIWNYDFISPNFDDGVTNEKVRVRGYQSYNKVLATPWAQVAPVYRIDPSEAPMDDSRFSIEFSLVDALNKDIINIFSTLDALDNALGSPNLAFGTDYPNLEAIKSVYFNRLTEKINLNKFFDMYRWFDASISSFIENIVPRKTEFLGSNFVVESHMLERHRKEYFHSDIYVGANDRHVLNNVLLLQEIIGVIVKH